MISDSYLSFDDKYSYFEKATAHTALGTALDFGHLGCFIGAGISKSTKTNFPNWAGLVKSCCIKSNIKFDSNKRFYNEYLLKKTEEVKASLSKEKYIELVKDALYEGVSYDNQLLHKDLLIALGSVLMISISRSSNNIINFNFDDLFEWYLEYHGYRIEIITDLSKLSGNSSVKIFHPHGFLPFLSKNNNYSTKNITFSLSEYDQANYIYSNSWNEYLRFFMSSKLILMIGMSGDDSHIRSVANHVYSKILNKKRILGFIFLQDTEQNRESQLLNFQNGLINLYFKDFIDLPEYLLEICRISQNLQIK